MTNKNNILNFMRNERYAGHDWVAGGTIERYIAQVSPSKPSTISRECRTLENDGFLIREIETKTIGGKIKRFVKYRLNPEKL